MSRLRHKFAAGCLLAFWLMATQHCALEAAGILSAHADQTSPGCVSTGGCANDGCATVEEGAYRPDTDAPAIASPQLFDCVYLICWSMAVPPPETSGGISLRAYAERPLDWVSTWQFVQRAALSPRAPSFV